ncbi:CEP350 [Branchiostoma lanceolatum]|uniref:CEP350 protein n=1 Tax=Branchiostoma lanceolatum TaxID=7740 RepID=A0A8K0F2Q2_BRALA|nr:CEP350 [Branchiostoma lanceolatum]
MASNIRARRVGEPSLVQRGPSPERYGGSLTAMSSAWKQLGQAKSVLRRAENRIEDAENFKMDASRNGTDDNAGRYMLPGGVSLSSRRYDREPSDRSVLMDHIPSYQITPGYPESTTDYRSRDRYPRDRPDVAPAPRKVSRMDGKYTDHLYQPPSRTTYTAPGLTSDLNSDLTRPSREYRSRSPVAISDPLRDRSKRVEFRDPLESYRSAADPKSSLHGSSEDVLAGNSGYGSAYGTANMADPYAPTYTVTDLSRSTREDRADSSIVDSSTNVKVLNDTSARVGADHGAGLLDNETTSPSRANHSGALFSSARDRIRADDRFNTDSGTAERRTTSDRFPTDYTRGISNVTNLLNDRPDIGSPVAQSTQKSPSAEKPPELYRPDEMSAEALTRTKSPVRKFEVVQRKKKELGGSDGLEKLKERIRKQRKEAGAAEDAGSVPTRRVRPTEHDDLSSRRLHSAEEPVASRGEEPYRSEVRSEVTPRIRKIKSAPPPPEYKGFSTAATKYRTQDGKVVTETELAEQQGKGHPGGKGQGSREAAAPPRRREKTKAKTRPAPRPASAPATKSPKPQRKVGAPQAAKTTRPSKKGIITTSAWREGQKAALKVLGPPPKLPKRSYSPPTKDTQTSTTSESSSVPDRKAGGGSKEEKEDKTIASDKDMSSDDDLSQHPLEDLSQHPPAAMDDGKAPNTEVLSKEARGVFDDLQLDKSDDDDSSTLKSEQPAAPERPAAQNKPSKAAKRKAPKASPVKESDLPATKLRHYDHSEVRRYMNKKRNERQRKLKEQRDAQRKAEEEKQKMLDDLDKKRREGWREHAREERRGRPKGSTFVKPPGREVDLPKRHPFHEDRRHMLRPTASEESDKENAGRRAERPWSASSASVSSEDRTPVVTPDSERSPEQTAAVLSRTSAPTAPSVTTTTVPPATTGPSISIKGIPSGREAAAQPDRPISFHDAYIEQLHGKQPEVSARSGVASLGNGGYDVAGSHSRPYSSAYSRYPIGGYRSSTGRSKAERIAALQATAESLQDRIETEARRIVEGLEGKDASPTGAGRWAYSRADTSPRQPTGVLPGTSNRDSNTAFTGDLPGISSITQHAADSDRTRRQDLAATKIQAAYRGHHVRQGLDWRLPSGRTLGGARGNLGLSAVDEETRSNTSSMSEGRLSGGSLSEETLTDSTLDSTRQDQPPGKKIADTLSKPEFCASTKKDDYHYKPVEPWKPREETVRRKYPWEEPRGDSLSVINIYTRQYEEARKVRHAQSDRPKSRTPSPRGADPYRNPSPQPDEYEEDFTSSTTSRPQHGSRGSGYRDDITGNQHGSRGSGYMDDRLHPTNGAKSHSYGSDRGHGSLPREPVGSSLHSKPIGREGAGRSSHYSRSAQDKDEDTLNSSLTLSSEDETPSPQRQPLHSQSSRSHSDPPRISDPPRTSPYTIDLRSRSPIDGTRRKTPSPTDGSVHRKTPSPIEGGTRRGVYSPTEGGYRRTPSPVEGRRDYGTSRYDRDVPRSSFRPLPTSGSYAVGSRYSPASLGNRMAAELNYLESVEESVRQLGDVERTRGVGMAQQESVSLAQILKARQQQHEREMAELTMKARQEAVEASRQLDDARRKAASTAAEAAQAIAHVRNEASSTINESARKLMETQAEATRATAEAAKQLAETASLDQTSALQAHDAGRLATETATAAATAAVTAAMEQQNRQQEQLMKTLQQGSQAYRSRDSRDRGRPDTRSSYSSSYTTTDYDSSKTSPAKTSLSKSPPSVEEKPPAKTRPRSPPRSEGHTDSISEDIPTVSDQSQKAAARGGNDTQSSIGEELPSGAADVSKDESIAEEIPEDKVSVSGSEYSYSMKFDESLTESEMEEMSFKMLLPSESHRRRSIGGKKQKTPDESPRDQSDAASYSSDELHSTVGSGKFTFEGVSAPFSAEDSFSHFMSDMVQQYMQEEEVRARHQASLLRLREKALKEKTKTELDWLEHQKKRLRDKGADDSMPPIRKRQRGLMLRLQTEQAEIKRLREANKAASRERQLLFMQQQEIMKMRQSTAAIRDKIRHRKKDTGASDEEIPEELSDKVPPPDRSAAAAPGDASGETPRDMKDSVSDAEAKMLEKLKKMHDPKDERYLTTREQKLQHRKKNAEDLLAWKQQLDAEEKKVRSLERQALSVWGQDSKEGKDKSSPSPQPKVPASPDSVVTESAKTADDSSAKKHRRNHSNQSESSVAEEIASHSSSIQEEIGTESNGDKPRPHDVSSDDTGQNSSIGEEYSNSFESPDTARTASKGPVRTPPPPKLDLGRGAGVRTRESLVSPRSQKVPGKRRESESGSEGESNPHTPSETASDQSDIEGRIRALNQELKQRKMVAERLKKEAKRRTREKLKAQEEALRKQLEAYDMFIKKTTEDLEREQREVENVVKPQIKQPRPATESPRRLKTPPDISPRNQSDLTRWKQRSESESSRSSKSSFEEESTQKDHTDSVVMPTQSIQPAPRSPAEERRIISPLPSPTRPEKLEDIRPRRLEGIHLELSKLEPAERSPRDPRSSVSSIAEEIPTEPSSARTARSEGSELSPRVKHVESPKLAKELEDKARAQQAKKKPEVEEEPESDSSQKSDRSFTSYSTASRHSQRTRTVSEKSDQSYSDDFEGSQRSYRSRSDRSPSVTSEEEISEHFSQKSSQSGRSTASSQSRHELFIDLKGEVGPATPSKATETAESDEERTPVPSPAETPTPRDRRAEIDTSTPIIVDPLAEYKLGDNVIVDGEKAGVLRFKGPTSFAPGMWAGVELRKAIGDNDGSRDGMRYFTCEPDRGVFVTPENLKPALEEYTSEREDSVAEEIPEATDRTDSDLDTPRLKLDFAESEKDFTPRRERTYSDDFDTPRSLPESREKSQQEEEPESEQVSLHSSDSELEKAISSAAAAVESFALETPEDSPRAAKEKDLAETPRDASDLPKDSSEENKDKLVEDITDDLASMVLQDSLSCITNLAESRQAEAEELEDSAPTSSPEKKPHTPLLDLLLREHEIQQRRAEQPPPAAPETSPEVTPRRQAEKFSESLVSGLFSDAISEILKIRKQKQRTSSDGRRLDVSRPSVVSKEFSETRDQDDSLDDEMNELQLPSSPQEPVPRPNSPVELHPRPGSPVFGEKLDEFQAQLDDILSTDQTWFEEDGIFGLGNRGAQKGQGASKRHSVPGESPEPQQSPRTSLTKLDLQKVTDDLFYAIPHNKEEVKDLVKSSVQVFYNNREYGDDLAPIATPRDLLSNNDTPGRDVESISKRSYKKIIFDLSGEVFKDIYAEDNVETPPVWMKPKKSQRKHFRRRPPGGLEELTGVVEHRVLVLLGLQPSRKLQHTTKFLKMGRKKKDQVDEILIEELATEEPEWVNYDDDELAVKLQLSDSIFENLLSETVQLVSDISLRKVGSHVNL